MRKFFKYFGYSRAERIGFSVLTTVIVLSIMVPFIYSTFVKSPKISYKVTYFTGDSASKERPLHASFMPSDEHQHAEELDTKLFYFDPNGLSVEEWSRLGLRSKQIAVIKNYESKGGRFYKKEDLAKIYSLSDKDYARLAPYVRIEQTINTVHHAEPKLKQGYPARESLIVDINTADTSAFKELNGIGPVLAARIVKYRDALGGFCAVDQLAEVYGLSAETFQSIKSNLHYKDNSFKKLPINTLSKEQLSKHPYISTKQAQWIVNFRMQHGFYKSLNDLRKIPILDDEFFRNIEAYIEY